MPSTRAQQNAFERDLLKIEAAFGRDLARLLRKSARATSVAEIARMIEAQNFAGIEAAFAAAIDPEALRDLTSRRLTLTVRRGSEAANVDLIGRIRRTSDAAGFEFAITENVQNFIDEKTASAVVGIEAPTVGEIRGFVSTGLEQGLSPTQTAESVREIVGLHPQYQQAVENRLSAQLAAGVPRDRAVANAKKHAEQLRRTRSRTIARTESGRAMAFGRQERWIQMQNQGIIGVDAEREWVTALDEIVGDDHRQMHGVRAILGQPYPVTPNGNIVFVPEEDRPNCRCTEVLRA